MLQSLNTLVGDPLHNSEGEIGAVRDLYFDDAHWAIRYVVATTGTWFGREVLLSPHGLRRVDGAARRLEVALTQEQIRHAPAIDTAVPVSRQHEAEYFRYYGWPAYWSGPGMWGFNTFPMADPLTLAEAPAAPAPETSAASHLQSAADVTGYHVEAADGEIGHVDDFLFEDGTWAIRYLVVDTGTWWPGKRILVPVAAIEKVDWAARHVLVNLTREKIQRAPEFENILPLEAGFVHRLNHYYGV